MMVMSSKSIFLQSKHQDQMRILKLNRKLIPNLICKYDWRLNRIEKLGNHSRRCCAAFCIMLPCFTPIPPLLKSNAIFYQRWLSFPHLISYTTYLIFLLGNIIDTRKLIFVFFSLESCRSPKCFLCMVAYFHPSKFRGSSNFLQIYFRGGGGVPFPQENMGRDLIRIVNHIPINTDIQNVFSFSLYSGHRLKESYCRGKWPSRSLRRTFPHTELSIYLRMDFASYMHSWSAFHTLVSCIVLSN